MHFKKMTLAVLAGAVLSTGTWATTPEDSSEIRFIVGNGDDPTDPDGFILIRGMDDLDLTTFDPNQTTNYTDSTDFCIYASGVADSIASVTFSVDKGSLSNTDTNITHDIPYGVSFETVGTGNGTASYTAPNLSFSDLTNTTLNLANGAFNCVDEYAKLTVSVTPNDASAAPAGTYNGTVTLTLSAR